MASDFMLRQRKLVEDIKKNKGVPPVKSIYPPDAPKPLATLNNTQNNTGNGIATSLKDAFYTPRLKESRGMVDKATKEGGFAAGVGMAARRLPGDFMTTARDYLTPKPLRDLTLGAASSVGTALSTAATGKYDEISQDSGSTIRELKDGIITRGGPSDTSYSIPGQGSITVHGDSKIRDPLNRGTAEQLNPDGSYRRGNLDVQFNDSVSPEAQQRFLANPVRPTAQIDRFNARTGPDTLAMSHANAQQILGGSQAATPLRELFTKDNSSMGWKSRLALNKQMLANEGRLEEQQARSGGQFETQGLRNIGSLAEQGLRNTAVAAGQERIQNTARDKNILAMKDRKSKNLKTQYDMINKQLEDATLSPEARLELQKQQAGIGKLLQASLQTPGQTAQRQAFEDQAAGY